MHVVPHAETLLKMKTVLSIYNIFATSFKLEATHFSKCLVRMSTPCGHLNNGKLQHFASRWSYRVV